MSKPYTPPFAVAASPSGFVVVPRALLVLIASHPGPRGAQLTVGKDTVGVATVALVPRAAPSLGSALRVVARVTDLLTAAEDAPLMCAWSVSEPVVRCDAPAPS